MTPCPLLVCPRHGSALPFNRQGSLWRFLTRLFFGRKKEVVKLTHMLFADDTLVFCNDFEEKNAIFELDFAVF